MRQSVTSFLESESPFRGAEADQTFSGYNPRGQGSISGIQGRFTLSVRTKMFPEEEFQPGSAGFSLAGHKLKPD